MSGNEGLSVLVGLFFVLIYSWYRFHVPATNRSSTTAARYYMAAVAYTLWGASLYLLIVWGPDLLSTVLAGMDKDEVRANVEHFFAAFSGYGLSFPLVVALAVTVMLPRVGPLAAVDRRIRERLEAMAAIPYEARRLSDQLAGSDSAADDVAFSVPETVRARVRRVLLDQDFQPEDIAFDEGARLARLWTKVAVLYLHIDGWKRDRRYVSFCSSCPEGLEEIRSSYAELTPRVKRCLRFVRRISADGVDVAGEYEAEVERQALRLLRRLYDVISAGVLQCELRQDDRTQRLATMGFHFTRPLRPSPILMLHRLTTLLTGLFVVLLIGYSVSWAFADPARRPPYPRIFGLAVTVALTYITAVFWAVYPKEQRWALAMREHASGERPVLFYMIAAVLAVASNAPIAFAWAWVKTQLWPPRTGVISVTMEFVGALSWLLIGFATAFVTALLIDDTRESPFRHLGRWSEALVLALVTAGAAAVAIQIQISYGRPPSGGVLQGIVLAGIVGFVLGACVPTWFRVAPRTRVETTTAARPAPDVEPSPAAPRAVEMRG